MLRRCHPGFDHHLVGANQRAVIRKQRPPDPPRPVSACNHSQQDHRRGQDGPHVEGIERLPLSHKGRQAERLEFLEQPDPMRLPEARRLGRGISGAILQRSQRPHFRRRLQHPGRLGLGRCPVALCTAPGEHGAHRKHQRCQQCSRDLVEPVERTRQGHRQEQHDQNEDGPVCAAQRQQCQPALRCGNLGRNVCQATVVSQSGTFSSAIDSSKFGRLRTISNRSPSTRTSGTSGRAL